MSVLFLNGAIQLHGVVSVVDGPKFGIDCRSLLCAIVWIKDSMLWFEEDQISILRLISVFRQGRIEGSKQ